MKCTGGAPVCTTCTGARTMGVPRVPGVPGGRTINGATWALFAMTQKSSKI